MIIFDTSAIAYTMLYSLDSSNEDITIDTMRIAMLSKIGYILEDLKQIQDIDNIVLACEGRGNWRKKIFKNYKHKRRLTRKKSKIDFKGFHNILNSLLDEFKNNLPFVVLIVPNAEADDIIATLVKSRHDGKVTIVSNDKDFRQLCDNKTKLFSHTKSNFIDNNDYDLFEHIIKGDSDDGIPNILSNENVFYEGVRQTTMSKKKKETLLLHKNVLHACPLVDDEVMRRYKLNEKLIDLTKIPNDIKDDILCQYDDYDRSKKKIFNYFVNKRLTKLMDRSIFNGL